MKFIETLKSVWKIEELRSRILLTLGLLLVYRFGAQIVLPGVDAEQLANLASQADGGLLGLLNAFTGGAFSNASVFALGIDRKSTRLNSSHVAISYAVFCLKI